MNFLFDDKYMKLKYDPMSGKQNRQWVQYADGVLEPVRRDGDLNKKQRDPRVMDWWVMEKPAEWDPLREGRQVSENHQIVMPQKMTTVPEFREIPWDEYHGGPVPYEKPERLPNPLDVMW